ncbi:MAG: nucleoside deaminase [Gemmatimonadetes bacterium]|nr:nucleoside deaminase [Gemmatimonadota bacterium]
MRLAIQECRKGIRAGQSPFGAVIVRGSRVVSRAHNGVWKETDITAHAEVRAIRRACRKLKTIDLSGCVIYSTCEPCPMCFAACHWAKLDAIVFGATIAAAARLGFSELSLSNREMKREGGSPIEVVPGVLKKETRQLFEVWEKIGKGRLY